MSGRIVHCELPYDDAERAKRFYQEAFGWEMSEMPGMEYTTFSTGPSGEQGPTEAGYIGGGMGRRGENMEQTMITIDVDSIDDALAKVEQLGGSVLVKRAPVADMGFTAYFADSEGNTVGLWETARQG